MRAKYEYSKKDNCIDILEIPYSSSIESIMKKATDMIKSGKLREVSDVRDAIDLNGFKLTFELKKDANPDLVMKKLFAATELENNFDCNFNILVEGTPMQLGVREILLEWIKFRVKCISRELNFELGKKEEKLHLLAGLAIVFKDIDAAIRIIRSTEKEADVVPNLMSYFGLTKEQAEFIAEIKLRYLNREYILNRLREIEELDRRIKEIKGILRDEIKQKELVIESLREIKKKYGKPRKTAIIGAETVEEPKEDIFFENYNCRVVCTRGGYFKKLSVQAARAADEHKLKEGDFIIYEEDTDNKGEVLFFTNKSQIYRARVCDFELSKAGQMGDYIPAKLSMDDGEEIVGCQVIYELVPSHQVVYIFENGKGVRLSMSVYDAKSRRRKISGACSSVSAPAGAIYVGDKPVDIFIKTNAGRGMIISSKKIPEMSTRTASGSKIISLPKRAGVKVDYVTDRIDTLGKDALKCRKTDIGSSGSNISQISFNF